MLATDGLRCERKFLISDLSIYEIEEVILLHPSLFSPIYQERFINNIYLDDLSLFSFYENQNGTTNRKKVRIRWYGELAGQIIKPSLEIKKKNGIVGTKDYHTFPDFNFDQFFSHNQILDLAKTTIVDENLINELVLLEPTLINRYHRKYFLSADGVFRITLDSKINFYSKQTIHTKRISNSPFEPYSILELKYNHCKDDIASEITKHFPFRLTKSSKYVSGIYKLKSEIE
jgi:hypothetical protein